MVKVLGVQRESEGVVVRVIGVQHNAPGGKGPCCGHAGEAGKHEGMTGAARSNHPNESSLVVADDQLLVVSPVKVRQLQQALWAAAKQSKGRRFHALYGPIHRHDVLWEAWERVRKNRGAAGVDRLTLVAVEDWRWRLGAAHPATSGGGRLTMRCLRALRIFQPMPAVGSPDLPVAPQLLSGLPGKNERLHPFSAAHMSGTPSIIMSPDSSVDPDKAGRRHAQRRLPHRRHGGSR